MKNKIYYVNDYPKSILIKSFIEYSQYAIMKKK